MFLLLSKMDIFLAIIKLIEDKELNNLIEFVIFFDFISSIFFSLKNYKYSYLYLYMKLEIILYFFYLTKFISILNFFLQLI